MRQIENSVWAVMLTVVSSRNEQTHSTTESLGQARSAGIRSDQSLTVTSISLVTLQYLYYSSFIVMHFVFLI